MKTHKFDVDDAARYGIEKAILLEHLKFHQEANTGNPDMMIDEKPHAFIKPETIQKMYPYLKYKSVCRWLKELEDDGVIESRKPLAKGGNHLKFYHVIGHNWPNSQNEISEQNLKSPFKANQSNSQNEKTPLKANGAISQNENSISQNETSKNSQNETSSIVTNVNIPYGAKSFKNRRNSVFWDKLYTRDEALIAMDQKRIPYSQMETYFEMTSQKRGNLVLWRPT